MYFMRTNIYKITYNCTIQYPFQIQKQVYRRRPVFTFKFVVSNVELENKSCTNQSVRQFRCIYHLHWLKATIGFENWTEYCGFELATIQCSNNILPLKLFSSIISLQMMVHKFIFTSIIALVIITLVGPTNQVNTICTKNKLFLCESSFGRILFNNFTFKFIHWIINGLKKFYVAQFLILNFLFPN